MQFIFYRDVFYSIPSEKHFHHALIFFLLHIREIIREK